MKCYVTITPQPSPHFYIYLQLRNMYCILTCLYNMSTLYLGINLSRNITLQMPNKFHPTLRNVKYLTQPHNKITKDTNTSAYHCFSLLSTNLCYPKLSHSLRYHLQRNIKLHINISHKGNRVCSSVALLHQQSRGL